MEKDPIISRDLALSKKKAHKKLVQRFKKEKRRGRVDEAFTSVHNEVFEEMDCLECANCCKTTSPIFIEKDIERLSRHLGIKPAQFVESYLTMDNDGDYVLQSSPCTFLQEDNTCAVYEVRPRACKEYPHTDRKNIQQILPLTVRNAVVCPAVFEMLERLRGDS